MEQMKSIGVGIIGLGRAGVQMHLHELSKYPEMYHVAACCDILPERVENFRSKCPDAVGYSNADDLISDPRVELVSVVSPSRFHVSMACKALAAGKFVFLEKPFALSREGAERLKKADEMFPGKLFFRHNRRFEACFSHVQEVIRSGILGDVFEIKLRRLRHRFRDDWQTLLDCGGGQLNNWGPHLIDQSLQFLNYEVESIFSDLKRIAARGDAEDHIKIVFRGKNGMIVDMEISDAVTLDEPVISVYGTRGSLVSYDEQKLKMRYLAPSYEVVECGARREAPPLEGANIYETMTPPDWIEEEIPVAPRSGYDMWNIYEYLHAALCGTHPFAVKNREAFATVETTLKIREQHPEFACAGDIL